MSRLSEIPPTANGHPVEPLPAGEVGTASKARLVASVYPEVDDLEDEQSELIAMISELAPHLEGEPVLLIQNGQCPFGRMCDCAYQGIRNDFKANVQKGTKCTVIVHSGGGYAGPAYRLARFLQRYCGGYNVLIPSTAKSAATLFSLGADKIILGDDAELGPLDAQITDLERETNISALEVVQSVELLSGEALQAVDAALVLWQNRCGKKVETLLPVATEFVAKMMHPLFNKIDAVHFTGMARVLQVANDYAVRLLHPRYGADAAKIANALTRAYSDHDFAIDGAEALSLGLKVQRAPAKIREKVEQISLWLNAHTPTTITGRIVEHDDDQDEEDTNTEATGCADGGQCRTSVSGCANRSREQLEQACRKHEARHSTRQAD